MKCKPCDRLTASSRATDRIIIEASLLFQKSVDRSIQTVVSCLFNPENRLRSSFVSQEDYFRVCSGSKTKSLKAADLNFVHIQDTIKTKIDLYLLEFLFFICALR